MNTVTTTRGYAVFSLHTLIAGCKVIECLGAAIEVALTVADIIALPEAIVVGLIVGKTLLMGSVDDVD
jgi:hypothetical protein